MVIIVQRYCIDKGIYIYPSPLISAYVNLIEPRPRSSWRMGDSLIKLRTRDLVNHWKNLSDNYQGGTDNV